MNTTATPVVNFTRTVQGHELPKSVWLEPPKGDPMLAPLPLWSSTMMTNRKHTKMWMMLIKMCNGLSSSFQ